MVRTLRTIAFAGALAMIVAPASATILTLPFIGDIEHPDMDPFHVLAPAPAPEAAAAPAPAPMKKKHHHHHKKM